MRIRLWLALFFCLVCIQIRASSVRRKRQIVFVDEDDNRRGTPNRNSNCVTPDRRPGRCIRLTSCAALRRLAYNRIRRYTCGFEGQEPRVCCPQQNQPGTNVRPRPTPNTRRPPVRVTTSAPVVDRIGTSGTLVKPNFLPRDCGVHKFTNSRVVGGREAEKGGWPWMTVVYLQKRSGKSADCGGALVTNRHVVTAAHCVVGRGTTTLEPRLLSVRLGEHDVSRDNDGMNPIDVDVESVKRHEQFDPRTYRNDIAILTLKRPVEFNENISAICLPYDSLVGQNLTSRTVYVTGWGTTAFNGQTSPVLMEAGFDVVSQETCRRAYERELPITDVYLCAGADDGSKDSCQGDSGGPLNAIGKGNRYYLVGVVSFGKLCAQPGYPGVYTRVTKYLDWLATNLNN